ncbi:MAG: hypothetical protein HY965_03650, partial [Ignavibacteriales bacterium]|nr:hypothetical protein [Ignavibacteriales bacterium]
MRLNHITQNDELSAVVTQKMMESSTALQFAEFYRMVGNAEYARKAASASGGHFRMINDNYPDNISSPDFSYVSLKI